MVDGAVFTVAQGRSIGPNPITPPSDGNDVIEVERSDDASCGVGDAHKRFDAGQAYRLTVSSNGTAGCGSAANGPGITFSTAPT